MFSETQISLAKSFINSTCNYIKENRPSPKTAIIGAVAAVAAYIFINYLTSSETSNKAVKVFFVGPYETDLEVLNTIENKKVKTTFENFYNLKNTTLLNTDLELQRRPTRLAAILNHCGMKLGFSDQFENIRAENVIKKIEEFISENKIQFCLMKKVKNKWNPVSILRNFEIRTGKKCERTKELLEKTESVTLGQLLNFSEDQSHYFEFENVMNEILMTPLNSENEYVAITNLLGKLASVQRNKVSMEQEKNSPSPTILPFQTDPLKNAFMQLSIIYCGKGDLENAKLMLHLAVRDNDIKTKHWDTELPNNYFEFFGQTCIELAHETKDSDLDLSNKFLIAAKDYILKNDRSYAEALSHALDDAGLAAEAKWSRQKAIYYYFSEVDFYNIAFGMQTKPSLFISLMNLYAKEEMYGALQLLGERCFPNKQVDDLGLTKNQLQIWNVYQGHLPAINLANTLDEVEKNTI